MCSYCPDVAVVQRLKKSSKIGTNLTQKIILCGDLLLKRNPEVFFLGTEYLQAIKGSEGNIIKKSGNVKSFVLPD